MDLKKYYKLVYEQSLEYDKTQNCKPGQTWKFHLFPVINNAKMLAEKYGANKNIVEIAAIFHDYADLISLDNREIHHILGAQMAGEILKNDGFEDDFIKKVQACIYNHRASVVKEKNSMEEICVADADALAHIDNVVEIICWQASIGKGVKEANDITKRKVQKSYAKMSLETQAFVKEKYEMVIGVLNLMEEENARCNNYELIN